MNKPSIKSTEKAKMKTTAGSIQLDLTYAGIDEKHQQAWGEDYTDNKRRAKQEELYKINQLNPSENRSENHVALRDLQGQWKTELHEDILFQQERLQAFVKEVHAGKYTNSEGKPWQHVLLLGVGGSSLGTQFVIDALKYEYKQVLDFQLLDNIDPLEVQFTLGKLDLARTLVVVVSKTFSTLETMMLAKEVKKEMTEKLVALTETELVEQHFIAVTADQEKAKQFGIRSSHTFLFWEWVSGRFSVWSSVGLPIALVYGVEVWQDFLAGGHRMDKAYLEQQVQENPVWQFAYLQHEYLETYGAHAEAVVCYDARGKHLITYLQQLYMESLGKNAGLDNTLTNKANCSYLLGGEGTKDQHSYFQLIHQGKDTIPVHFISFQENENDPMRKAQHFSLAAQQLALQEGRSATNNPSRFFFGKKSFYTSRIKYLWPASLGRVDDILGTCSF